MSTTHRPGIEPILSFVQVHKRFGEQHVLRGLDTRVQKGSVHFLIGPSGVGKSVTIKMVVGLLRPDSGRVELDGVDVTRLSERELIPMRRRCQMIFQHATLFDAKPVLENVLMPVQKRFRISRTEARDKALRALSLVRADDLAERVPATLGQGVRKRIAVARALALEPEVLLYDEPTTGLDPVAARRTDRLIRATAQDAGLTALVVSHDLASVRNIGDRVSFLHDGRIAFEGTPSELFATEQQMVRDFVHGNTRRWQAQ